jgi:hypothetical protein
MGPTAQASTIADIERELALLRDQASPDDEHPFLRTSVMTHLAWVPLDWLDAARKALAGLAERHPSRSILLLPEPDAGEDGLEAEVSLECFPLLSTERQVCSEVIELHLRGARVKAPASIVNPLLVPGLPVFLRWRGQPRFGEEPFEQMVDLVDRLIVDSNEWPDLNEAYGKLAAVFPRTVVSDIAWARTSRWRGQLASLWPEIGSVQRIRVTGTKAQAYLLAGWLGSRLGRAIALEHVPADRLEGVEVDGKPTPFPPGEAPDPSDLLSDELDIFERDRIYEEAVRAAASVVE